MRRFVLIAAILLFLVPSAARAQYYGDPNSLVDSWYRTFLNRAPDPTGITYWVNQLNQNNSTDEVLASLLGSDEYYTLSGSTPGGFITRLYNNILHRPPTPNELNYWVSQMYTADRQRIADQFLNQNPGVWVGSGPAQPPPAVVNPPVINPGLELNRYRDWDRDRHGDWNHHLDIHEYRRPDLHFHRDDHHDRR